MSVFPTEQAKKYEELKAAQEKVFDLWNQYWWDYSGFDTWQFWLNIVMIVLPLIFLYLFIDRKRLFLLLFFGFNIHIWSAYLDGMATRANYIGYPYKAIPMFPIHFGMDTSLVPVLFILMYQYTIEKKANFYLHSLILIFLITFILKPILAAGKLFILTKGTNYFHIFLGYVIIVLFSKGITNFFLKMTEQKAS